MFKDSQLAGARRFKVCRAAFTAAARRGRQRIAQPIVLKCHEAELTCFSVSTICWWSSRASTDSCSRWLSMRSILLCPRRRRADGVGAEVGAASQGQAPREGCGGGRVSKLAQPGGASRTAELRRIPGPCPDPPVLRGSRHSKPRATNRGRAEVQIVQRVLQRAALLVELLVLVELLLLAFKLAQPLLQVGDHLAGTTDSGVRGPGVAFCVPASRLARSRCRRTSLILSRRVFVSFMILRLFCRRSSYTFVPATSFSSASRSFSLMVVRCLT